MRPDATPPLGAVPLGRRRCAFSLWAPGASRIEVRVVSPEEILAPMSPDDRGYHHAVLDGVDPGSRYFYRLPGGADRPDPASRSQPLGVHGPSEVVDPSFPWSDAGWPGPPLGEYVLYELHVGTFTEEGTFDAVIPRLEELKDLGITAIELMPVAQFPGGRNWGYDGVQPFAVQNSYGGPAGLKRLVDACHRRGLAAVLDVVYNHLGPEGNYLGEFAPYFTDRYRTPWGSAVNFDGPHSDEVRRYFIENALYWLEEFHFDALRLDAIHAIRDFSAIPFLKELAEAAHRRAESLSRRFHLIAESDLNDPRFILPSRLNGHGLDAQWSDDFHHSLHVLLTGERSGYYADFDGLRSFSRTLRQGFAFTGEYSIYRKRRHGCPPLLTGAKQFVVCAQNHDQVGNRMLGERLGALIDFEGLKLAAGAVILSPFIPLLFMGEEYGERAPFQYFTSHSDPNLVEAVRRGRRDEFAAFHWKGEVPDPQAEETFARSKLRRAAALGGERRALREFHRELLRLRRGIPAIARADKDSLEVHEHEAEKALSLRYWTAGDEAVILFSFAMEPVTIDSPIPAGKWRLRLDSALERWDGPGSAFSQELISTGGVRLVLAARSVVVLHRMMER